MFGFVVANPERLTEEQRKKYKAVYCGVCEGMGRDRGFRYRMALTYDLAFLAIVLSSVNNEGYDERTGRCPVHPARKRAFLENTFTRYAADMNIALAYYKYLDDKKDDGSVTASLKARLFGNETEKIRKKYPDKCSHIVNCLDELEKIERADVLQPDIPADVFGKMLGGVFSFGNEDLCQQLYDFGYSLGKFIYVMDAAVDLKSDIKKKRYNPLIRYSLADTEGILEMLMADCVEKYRLLPVNEDKEIIENILFSGVWTRYTPGRKGLKSEQRPL